MAKYGFSYFGNRIPKYVKKDLLDFKKIGFEIVLHTFSENDFLFYKDTMKRIVSDSKKLGYEVWLDPWGYGGIFGGEAFSGFLQNNIEESQISNKEERLGSVCLNSEKFRNYMKEWIKSCKAIGADKIFWDEPHFYIFEPYNRYPEEFSCRCDTCKKNFYKIFNYEMPTEFNEDIKTYRNIVINDFLKEMTNFAKGLGIDNIICFVPEEAYETGINNYEQISSLKTISNIGSDPYWYGWNKNVQEFVGKSCNEIKSLSIKYNKDSHMWIQSFKVPEGRENEIEDAVIKIKESGIENILFWGIRGCEHISSISSDNPEKVWNIITQIIKKDKN
ncbi:hypothetical protein [Oceanotoga teriensis]|uniref:hypothetical protein n=1 Tax=Oceanotoga teriensis TaxID=515440 RepID=UPI00271379FD|nr:hypothetical protein [Oceanotoga teriensis]MDO7976622.1 hypothetical protein [Oceanotoga teriensis]